MTKNPIIRRHSFKSGAMSITQMGEELIGHPSTALNELVKNGYDADALKCQVYFQYNEDITKSFAFVYDNGNGMDDEILFGEWLHTSVSSKRKPGACSEIFKRHFLGRKGIGRLSAMKLGKIITVLTKKSSEAVYNWMTIDRDIFNEEKLLDKIDFPGDCIDDFTELFCNKSLIEIRNGSENSELIKLLKNNEIDGFLKGTLIIIEQLDESVIKILQDDFINQKENFANDSLKQTTFFKSLATLITPLSLGAVIQKDLLQEGLIKKERQSSEKKNTFSIEYGTNLLPDQKGSEIDWQSIEAVPILSVFDYRVFGKVTKDRSVDGYFIYNRLDNDLKKEKFEIPGKALSEDNRKGAGEYYFDIRIYDIGENDNLEKLAKKSNLKSGVEFKRAFKNFQGLRVSKTGFGVKPYGEEVEDWIGLSKARVQDPGHNVNTNQILGYIFFFSPENDKLEEKTNREGFLEDTPFIEVKETLLSIFKSLGNRRYNYRALHDLGRIPKSKHLRPDIGKYLNTLNKSNNLYTIRKYSEKFMKEVTTAMDNLEESLSFSERLASLGSGLELVYHEMAQPISGLKTTNASLILKKDKIEKQAKNDFALDIDSINDSTDALIELRQSLQPAIGRSRKKKFVPYQTFLKVCSLFRSDLEKYQISVKADERMQDYEITDFEYAFWISFLNIVNNAVYWIKRFEKPGEIRLNMKGKSFIVSNSGPLINESVINNIFEYGVTTRPEKNATGLGLSFTRSILSNIKWEITAENRNDGPAFIIKGIANE